MEEKLKPEDIAWEYLEPIEKAQLIQFYPELLEEEDD